MTSVLLSGTTAVATGTAVPNQNNRQNTSQSAIVQVEITGAATVVIEGRVSPSAPWVLIDTYTSSEARQIARLCEIRARVSVYTSGTVNAWLEE